MKQIVSGLDFLRQAGIVAYYGGEFKTAEMLKGERNDANRTRGMGKFIENTDREE